MERETDGTEPSGPGAHDDAPDLPVGLPDRSGADPTSFPGTVVADTDRIAAALEVGPIETPVPSCPGFDLRRLAVHVGWVHRWATLAIRNGVQPDRDAVVGPSPELDAGGLGAWLRDGVSDLADVLDDIEPGAPTWHPFPLEQRAWVWRRRMLIETMLHRWDAGRAVDATSTLRTDLSLVGLHEYFELGVRRVVQGSDAEYPDGSLRVRCTDPDLANGAGDWLLGSVAGEYVLTTGHGAAEDIRADAAVSGAAEDVLLAFAGRRDQRVLDITGDEAAAAAWLGLPPW